MWILILTLHASYQSGSAIAMQQGFSTQESCMVAARAWIEQSRKEGDRYHWLANAQPRALCVKQN